MTKLFDKADVLCIPALIFFLSSSSRNAIYVTTIQRTPYLAPTWDALASSSAKMFDNTLEMTAEY